MSYRADREKTPTKTIQSVVATARTVSEVDNHRFLVGGSLLLLLLGQTSRLGGVRRLLPVHLLLLDIGHHAALVVGKVVDDTRHERPVRLFILRQQTAPYHYDNTQYYCYHYEPDATSAVRIVFFHFESNRIE